MGRTCSVLKCKGEANFKFPAKSEVRSKWLLAIKRPSFAPKGKAGLCAKHFLPEDFMSVGAHSGIVLERTRLKSHAVPSLELGHEEAYQTPPKRPRPDEDVPMLERSVSSESEQPLQRQESDLGVNSIHSSAPSSFEGRVVEKKEIVCEYTIASPTSKEPSFRIVSADCVSVGCGPDRVQVHDAKTQTVGRLAPYTVTDFQFKPQALRDLTGLDSYELFILVFRSLGPAVNNIKYRNGKVMHMSLEDQLFLTLWKLRKATTDVELSTHFGVHHTAVSNIFFSFVTFMADQWGKLNLWPSRDLVNFYMPAGFKKLYPSTRVIVDGTEIPIQKPKNPRAQQATFSTYKNTNTLKALVGASPAGLLSYVTECYGGSVSDRQITERSALLNLCERKDSIMADRGFNVQDQFAPKGVTVNMPEFLKGRDHLPGTVIMKDRKLASRRVHIERLWSCQNLQNFTTQDATFPCCHRLRNFLCVCHAHKLQGEYCEF